MMRPLSLPPATRRGGALLARAQLASTRVPPRIVAPGAAGRPARRGAGQQAEPNRPPAQGLPRDEHKEEARKYRRTTFGFDEWAAHRSSGRYFRHVCTSSSSHIIRGLLQPLGYVGLCSLAVCVYEQALAAGALPDWGFPWRSVAMDTSGPTTSFSTFALSLLLVFRTNSSYQRWAEARRLWGGAINRLRDIARQVTQWSSPGDVALTAALCRWTVAFPYAMACSLREDMELQPSLEGVLLPHELQMVMLAAHPPTAVLQAMGAYVNATSMTGMQKMRVDEQITALQDILGGCERIFRTPIPLCYTRHTSRFLICWMTFLPFCIVHSMGLLTPAVAMVVAFFLFGIEEIGVQVEEPFGILALEAFCRTIASNVHQAEAAAAAARAAAQGEAAPMPIGLGPAAANHAGGSRSAAADEYFGVRSTLLHLPGLSGLTLMVTEAAAAPRAGSAVGGAADMGAERPEELYAGSLASSGSVAATSGDYTFS